MFDLNYNKGFKMASTTDKPQGFNRDVPVYLYGYIRRKELELHLKRSMSAKEEINH